MERPGGMAARVEHGGSLDRARALFPDAPDPFVDLSTGINPHPYPLFEMPATALSRLPEAVRGDQLAKVAAQTYGAPSPANVAAGPGTQILLPRVASLLRPGRARVLGPTYAEHARAAAIAGHAVEEVTDFAALAEADLAVVVNPNNPDGRLVRRDNLLELGAHLHARGGLLVVDEAFMDVGPKAESLAADVARGGIVVLRSFGKFFGLAGIRLGFALADEGMVERLEMQLGPWSVSGPALEYGIRALADSAWQDGMRVRLAAGAKRLDALLARHGVEVKGGTSLFRYLEFAGAPGLFRTLGRHGVLPRHFERRPHALRVGLPGDEGEWRRLEAALASWARKRHG